MYTGPQISKTLPFSCLHRTSPSQYAKGSAKIYGTARSSIRECRRRALARRFLDDSYSLEQYYLRNFTPLAIHNCLAEAGVPSLRVLQGWVFGLA
jgi:hypothetical protein